MAVNGSSKCRICLQENSNMKNLSNEFSICGQLLTISDIIIISTNIQLLENENFPKKICETCLQDANTAYAFKKRCENAENFFKLQSEDNNIDFTQLLENTDEESELKNETFLLEEHKSNDNKFVCNICCNNFSTEKDLNNHLKFHNSNSLRSMRRVTRNAQNSEKINKNSDEIFEKNNYETDNESIDNSEIKEEIDDNFMDINNICENSVAKANRILKNTKHKNENGFYECICCEDTFENNSDLKKHIKAHNFFKCKICNKKFSFLSNLRRHLKSYNSKIKNEKSEETNTEIILINNQEFKCIACGEFFSKRKYLSEHLKKHKEFNCRLCPAKFTFATNLRKHLNWHNRPKEAIKTWKQLPAEKRTCDVCFKVFKYRPSMLKHRKKHDSSGKICKFCDQIFESSIKLYKHMEEIHADEKNVVCSQCGKKFFKEWNLKMHMIVHSGAKPYMCEICGISFALVGNLASHKRLHTGVKPYKCETCGRGFTQQAALRSHEAGHSDRKDFICPDCGAAFSRIGAMRNHRKRHQSTKPFSCSMCPKKFTFSSERKRHMAIHTGERNHVCEICGKAFNRPTNLTVHRRIHTREFPFKCDLCGKGFIQAHCMKTHRNTHTEFRDMNIENRGEEDLIGQSTDNVPSNSISG